MMFADEKPRDFAFGTERKLMSLGIRKAFHVLPQHLATGRRGLEAVKLRVRKPTGQPLARLAAIRPDVGNDSGFQPTRFQNSIGVLNPVQAKNRTIFASFPNLKFGRLKNLV